MLLTAVNGNVTWNVFALKTSGTMNVDKMVTGPPAVMFRITIFSMDPEIQNRNQWNLCGFISM